MTSCVNEFVEAWRPKKRLRTEARRKALLPA
jgi:hypothetical protein